MARTARIIAVSVLLLLGGYVGAYFACSEYSDPTWYHPAGRRVFDGQPLLVYPFEPLGELESLVRGHEIFIADWSGVGPISTGAPGEENWEPAQSD